MSLPRSTQSSRIGELAVTLTQRVFEENGWKFRRQEASDFGVDAECERVVAPYVTGQLIKLQIKGTQRIDWTRDGACSLAVRSSTWALWRQMRIPTFVVLCSCEDAQAYWVSPFEFSPSRGALSVSLSFERARCLTSGFSQFTQFAYAFIENHPDPEFIWEVPGFYEMFRRQLLRDRDWSDFGREIDREQDFRARLFYRHVLRLRTAVGLPVHDLLPLHGFYLRSRAFGDWGEGPLFREVFSELIDYLTKPYIDGLKELKRRAGEVEHSFENEELLNFFENCGSFELQLPYKPSLDGCQFYDERANRSGSFQESFERQLSKVVRLRFRIRPDMKGEKLP